MDNKVPAITTSFRAIKVLSTTVGETGADYLGSGHAAAATLLYGVAAMVGIALARTLLQRAAIAALAMAMVVAIAFSRLYLGVHFSSDVLAGITEASSWLLACLALARRFS